MLSIVGLNAARKPFWGTAPARSDSPARVWSLRGTPPAAVPPVRPAFPAMREAVAETVRRSQRLHASDLVALADAQEAVLRSQELRERRQRAVPTPAGEAPPIAQARASGRASHRM